MAEQWPERDSIEFNSLHGDEINDCNECGTNADSEYCQLCAPHMEDK